MSLNIVINKFFNVFEFKTCIVLVTVALFYIINDYSTIARVNLTSLLYIYIAIFGNRHHVTYINP